MNDLGDIWRYVTDQSDAVIADRLEEESFAGFDLLARFPELVISELI